MNGLINHLCASLMDLMKVVIEYYTHHLEAIIGLVLWHIFLARCTATHMSPHRCIFTTIPRALTTMLLNILCSIYLHSVYIKLFEFFVVNVKHYHHWCTLYLDHLPLGWSMCPNCSPLGRSVHTHTASTLSSTISHQHHHLFPTYSVYSYDRGICIVTFLAPLFYAMP